MPSLCTIVTYFNVMYPVKLHHYWDTDKVIKV